MNGSHLVKISRRRGTKYTFTIKRNITIVRGDSGTGKTTLFDMVADYMRTGEQSGVSLQCDCPCVALTDYDWRNQLSSVHDSIVFVDEGLKEIHSDEFAHHVLYSSNYFVLISRADFPNLPYSVDEIYKIKTSGKKPFFRPCLSRSRESSLCYFPAGAKTGHYLREITGDSVFHYDKDCIPEAFCTGGNSAKVMALIACRNVR